MGGFKHDLYEITATTTAKSVRMQFTGSNLRIYALALLETGLEINTNGANRAFSRIEPRLTDRTGRLVEDRRTGGVRWVEKLGASREKWLVDLQIEFKRNVTVTSKEFTYWRAANRNCFFANEFSRNPDEVYPAAFTDLEIANPYRNRWKGLGRRVPCQIGER